QISAYSSSKIVKCEKLRGPQCSGDAVDLVGLHAILEYQSSQCRDDVILQETLGSEHTFDNRTEHHQSKHVEKKMRKVGMHKHVRKGLPYFKKWRIRIENP